MRVVAHGQCDTRVMEGKCRQQEASEGQQPLPSLPQRVPVMKLTYPLAPPSRTISVFSLNVLCKNFLLAERQERV